MRYHLILISGITDQDTINNIWFDPNYGFRTFLGFQNWVKVSYFRKQIDTGIGMYLQTYFKITRTQMQNIALNTTNWLFATCNSEMSKPVFV